MGGRSSPPTPPMRAPRADKPRGAAQDRPPGSPPTLLPPPRPRGPPPGAREGFPPDLAAAVEAVRPERGPVRDHRPLFGNWLLGARGQFAVRRAEFVVTDDGAAGGEDHSPGSGFARRLEDVVNADDIVPQHFF